jgi:glycosyltransferase involved in cell wall biosynthesis
MFSLIVATKDRVSELERLLTSLDAQTYRNFEVIIIDQNKDGRLAPVLQRHSGLDIHHLESEPGAGRARNVGLREARGDVICFPDDDCWYPASLLESVRDWLEGHREFDAVFTTMRDEKDQPVGPRWPPGPVLVTRNNVWDCTIFVSGFLRRAATDAIGMFREDIGVGAKSAYQSGEETDYFLRALALGFRMWYEPALTVHHPKLHDLARMRAKTLPYALGCGYVLRRHGYTWWEFGRFLARSMGGAVFSLCKGDLPRAKDYLLRGAGQLRGYCCGERDLARLAEPRT